MNFCLRHGMQTGAVKSNGDGRSRMVGPCRSKPVSMCAAGCGYEINSVTPLNTSV